jgi:hypothetical protein
LCCLKPPAALAIAQEALAPPRKSIAEVDDDAMARAVHKAAGVYAIPKEHVAWMLLDYLKTASR